MVRLSIYNNSILVPAKCGSRFLDTIWETKEYTNTIDLINDTHPITKIIVRHPYEHLLSALHTDLLHIWNREWGNAKEEDIIKNYTELDGGSHYQLNLYKTLYDYWVKNGKRAKIVKLENLTDEIKNVGVPYNFDKDDYNWKPVFDNWKTKEEIEAYIEQTYPNEYIFLNEKIIQEVVYYLKMINNE